MATESLLQTALSRKAHYNPGRQVNKHDATTQRLAGSALSQLQRTNMLLLLLMLLLTPCPQHAVA